MQDKNAKSLFEKYQAGTTTKEETAFVENYIDTSRGDTDTLLSEAELVEEMQKLTALVELPVPLHRSRKLWLQWSAAAAVLLLAPTAFYFWQFKSPLKDVIVTVRPNQIRAGKNSATLVLANGKEIELSDASNGKLAEESGVTISKTANGQVVYQVAPSSVASNKIKYNTLKTANGQEYQLILGDGTHVYLNAGSELSFPTTFTDVTRKVTLNGEAYFEVAKDKRHPFIVESKKQTVQVLGTHFNVSSYADQPSVNTTLVEGSVKVVSLAPSRGGEVGKTVTLVPGQKSTLINENIQVSKADIDDELAWKDGYFRLDHDTFRGIMSKISRWYNVEVVYEVNPDQIKIGGMIPRSVDITSVLNLLGQTRKVHFKIEGRRVTVIE